MPLYEYECSEHGVFELIRGISEARQGAPCPECASEAPRILSAPAVSSLSRATRVAHERNERSRHEPRVVRNEGPRTPERGPPRLHQSGGRPWALEHG
jgi:putative FmdB family regulatory protein